MAADPVAIYGAFVATAVLSWSVLNEVRRRETRLKLEPSRVTIFNHPTLASDAEPALMVKVINDSEHPVKITSWGFDSQTSDRQLAMLPKPELLTLPLTIAAKDGGDLWIPESLVKKSDLDFTKPIVAWCRTSNGKEIKSKSTVLNSEPVGSYDT